MLGFEKSVLTIQTLLFKTVTTPHASCMSKYLLVFLLAFATRGLLADDFKTIEGKEYKNVTVSRVEPDGIVLTTSSGISKVYFAELPKEVQERFHYDAAKGTAYSAQQNANLEALRKQQQEAQQKRTEEIEKYRREHPNPEPQRQPSTNVTGNSLTGNASLSGNSMFLGSVVSITNGGSEAVLTVEPSVYENLIGGVSPKRGTAVYVYADFRNAVDGDRFKFMGQCVGQVQYRTAIGGMATVLGFRGNITPLPPWRTNY
jgi:hypothetical protein